MLKRTDRSNWVIVGVYVDFGVVWCICTDDAQHEELRTLVYTEIVTEPDIVLTQSLPSLYGIPVVVYTVTPDIPQPLDFMIIASSRNSYAEVLNNADPLLFPKNAQNFDASMN